MVTDMFYKSECMWVASCKIACKENLMPFIHVSRILHFHASRMHLKLRKNKTIKNKRELELCYIYT